MAKNKPQRSLGTKTVGVEEVATDSLKPNPHNPRMLFDREPLGTLRESIAKVGILVPLTVYFDSRREQFIILDGQRRWMCATDLKLETVPVNKVAEPTLVQNIVTMFQIHKLREDWELMPSALKLELLMDELGEKNPKRLAELTGLDQAVVVRCKKLLSYPKKYQDMMLDPDPKKRIKADFFIELYPIRTDRLVKTFDWFKPDRFTRSMLKRYLEGGLKSVTDFRKVKQHINNARKAKKVKVINNRLREFSENASLGVEHLEIESATAVADARSITRDSDKLLDNIKTLDVETCVGEAGLWESLNKLRDAIQEVLATAGWRDRG